MFFYTAHFQMCLVVPTEIVCTSLPFLESVPPTNVIRLHQNCHIVIASGRLLSFDVLGPWSEYLVT